MSRVQIEYGWKAVIVMCAFVSVCGYVAVSKKNKNRIKTELKCS